MSVGSLELPAGRSPVDRILAWRRAWLTIEEKSSARAFVSRPLGMVAVHGGLLAALALSLQLSLPMVAIAGLTLGAAALWPRRRLTVLLVASLVVLFLRPYRTADYNATIRTLSEATFGSGGATTLVFQMTGVLAFLILAQGMMAMMRFKPDGLVARRPLWSHGIAFGTVLGLASILQPGSSAHAGLWTFVAAWASCFWFLAYAMADQKAKNRQPEALRALYMRPFWGGDAAPFGKGLSFLARFEATDDEALARTRLKALKLAVWCALLSWMTIGLSQALHGWGASQP